MITLSVDPGLHGLGCGLWSGTELLAGWYAGPPGTGRGPARWRAVVEAGLAPLPAGLTAALVVETMAIYPHMKGDPDDILEVQGVVGMLVGARPWSAVTGYTARVWKGQLPAPVMAARIEKHIREAGMDAALDPACPARRRGDMLHGVGVGWFHLRSGGGT